MAAKEKISRIVCGGSTLMSSDEPLTPALRYNILEQNPQLEAGGGGVRRWLGQWTRRRWVGLYERCSQRQSDRIVTTYKEPGLKPDLRREIRHEDYLMREVMQKLRMDLF